ncbi:hypothetical protein SeLEV6574_g07835 [Synchytrium endobioticum]|uniref:Fe2OG dioxygenase domain-containing protein n=1 Tax=Synchytrium endobioticum TaxID=286115 RepID=A0A507CFE2_9FUNG|nr:hypothetical protein SeLEV6574_g07835 [Synchytrium endobioticum]
MPSNVSLPIIDISPFLLNAADKSRKPTIAKQMRHACLEFGFMYITNHGIPANLVAGVRDLAMQFFELPDAEKDKIHISRSDMARGYQPLGQNITRYKRDWHEGIDFYAAATPTQTYMLAARGVTALTGPNQYPYTPPSFRDTVDTYIRHCTSLGMAVMRAVALSLGLAEDHFNNIEAAGDAQVGISCGEHCDYGCLTILNTDDTTGALQVLGKDGVWLAADPVPGCFVINIGDMLRNLTNGLYQSTLHRVIHTKGSYRVSVPFFFEPAFDAVISPIPELVDETGGIPHHKPVMYGNHLLSKFHIVPATSSYKATNRL